MPQERDSNYPHSTAAEVDAAPGDPATKAARNIMVRNITGIPRRAFLMGDNDAAPILQGVRDLTGACYDVLAAAEQHKMNSSLTESLGVLRAILAHHGCPTEAPLIEREEA